MREYRLCTAGLSLFTNTLARQRAVRMGLELTQSPIRPPLFGYYITPDLSLRMTGRGLSLPPYERPPW